MALGALSGAAFRVSSFVSRHEGLVGANSPGRDGEVRVSVGGQRELRLSPEAVRVVKAAVVVALAGPALGWMASLVPGVAAQAVDPRVVNGNPLNNPDVRRLLENPGQGMFARVRARHANEFNANIAAYNAAHPGNPIAAADEALLREAFAAQLERAIRGGRAEAPQDDGVRVQMEARYPDLARHFRGRFQV